MIARNADVLQMLARQGHGFSPSCCVTTTSSGYTGGLVREYEHAHVSGRGVFMEELLAELEQRSLTVRVEEVGG